MALNQGVVDLVHHVLAEGTFEDRVGALALGHDHDARGPHIQARDDALALGGPGGGHPDVHRLEGSQHVGAVPAHGGVGGHTRRLVDDDDVLVLVEQCHSLDGGGNGLDGTRVGQIDLEEITGVETIGLGQCLYVPADIAMGAQVADPAAGQARHTGQGCIDPFAVESVGDGQETQAHSGSTGAAGTEEVGESAAVLRRRLPVLPDVRADAADLLDR